MFPFMIYADMCLAPDGKNYLKRYSYIIFNVIKVPKT